MPHKNISVRRFTAFRAPFARIGSRAPTFGRFGSGFQGIPEAIEVPKQLKIAVENLKLPSFRLPATLPSPPSVFLPGRDSRETNVNDIILKNRRQGSSKVDLPTTLIPALSKTDKLNLEKRTIELENELKKTTPVKIKFNINMVLFVVGGFFLLKQFKIV